jgi:transposase
MSAIRPISDLQFGVANTEIDVIQAPEPGPRIMRYELTDFEWTAIKPFLPNKPRGVSCYNRFVRWRMAGIWDLIMEALAETHDGSIQMIDTSVVRVHQHGGCAGGGETRLGWTHRLS